MKILINHIGYKNTGRKIAIAACSESESLSSSAIFSVIKNEITIFKAQPGPRICVDGWRNRFYHILDFSPVIEKGTCKITINDKNLDIESPFFNIDDNLSADKLISDILFYLKSQRCSWIWNNADKNMPFYGDRNDKVDVSGGWYDASGDYSKYLSHLSYADYFNPQQTPLVVWSLLKTYDKISADCRFGPLLSERTLDEAIHGADFLVRMQDAEGFFYTTVFDQWSKDTSKRMISSFSGFEGKLSAKYQAGLRQGAGMSIAALAKASQLQNSGTFNSNRYLETAIRGWEHLEKNNLSHLENGRENIIDSYCALIAAVELYKTKNEKRFIQAARQRATELINLYSADNSCWLVEKGSSRPYFHASDAGLPILALIEYCSIEKEDTDLFQQAKQLIKTSVFDLIKLTGNQTDNPFMLARQLVKPVNSETRASFFMPHENETGYWWQGENARLASLSYAVRLSKQFFDSEDTALIDSIDYFADSQIHWILGRNPYDICMLQGRGRNNPEYEKDSPNAAGGICNGITAGFDNERDIDFLPEAAAGLGAHRWRWSEQWLPHAAWFLLSVTL